MKKSMKNHHKAIVLTALGVVMLELAALFLRQHGVAVFDPQGPVAHKERGLIFFALLLSLVIVVPVFALTFGIAWKYRASNTKTKYNPELDGNRLAETIWWLVPTALIVILSVVTWVSTHELDPYKPLNSSTKPITVQVVALNWKWLFIYPEQEIATVNTLQFPEKTPINFEITSDATMNSFWIPQLGGQVYAMSGMSTRLHLMASKTGSYNGASANISGEGFSGMKFVATSSSRSDFDSWVHSVKHSPNQLDHHSYETLAKPSKNNPPAYYSLQEKDLYNQIVMKYMMPHEDGHMHLEAE